MTGRTRTSAAAPAKKTAAARKTTTRPPRKTTAKKTTAVTKPSPTLVDLRHPLPVRRRSFVGPMGATEQAAARAALASAMAQLPIPTAAWEGPTARLADGTVLTHTDTRLPAHNLHSGQPAQFTAVIRCPHGAIHTHTIHTALDLHRARLITAQCDQQTTSPEHDQAITRGVQRNAIPPQPLARLQIARKATADTQPLTEAEIAAGLAARADTETPKGHPQP